MLIEPGRRDATSGESLDHDGSRPADRGRTAGVAMAAQAPSNYAGPEPGLGLSGALVFRHGGGTTMRTLLLSALALGTLSAATLAAATAPEDGRVLARFIAGTYLAEQGGSTAADPRFVLLTLTENGAVLVVNSSQVGLNFSDEQGAWERTGPLQITATTYNFEFGDPGDTALREIVRVRYEVNFEPRAEGETPGQEGFDPRLEDVSGVYIVEFFPPGFDVLDPEATPIAALTETFEGRRVPVTLPKQGKAPGGRSAEWVNQGRLLDGLPK